jgi:hypothetical protein
MVIVRRAPRQDGTGAAAVVFPITQDGIQRLFCRQPYLDANYDWEVTNDGCPENQNHPTIEG